MSAYDSIVLDEPANFGTFEFTAERIKDWARKWDPQVFHTDAEKAKHTSFGGLCASGWHTCAVMMRLQVDYFRSGAGQRLDFGPSPGFEDLKWLRPVYAGDRITFVGRISEKRLSRSRPGLAILTTPVVATNQNGETVMSVTGHLFVLVG